MRGLPIRARKNPTLFRMGRGGGVGSEKHHANHDKQGTGHDEKAPQKLDHLFLHALPFASSILSNSRRTKYKPVNLRLHSIQSG
jgi:hypothetical protein